MMAQETIPSSSVGESGSATGPESDKQSANTKTARRRTKTGCLTCRKRRIKCGEERPICSNCIKSKRQCEGYNQRVVFKDGMNGLFRAGTIGGMDRRYNHPFIQPAPGPQLQPLAPAPPPHSQPMDPLDTTLSPHLRQIYEERRNEPPRSSPIPGIGPIIDDPQGHDLQPEYSVEYGHQHQELSQPKDDFSVYYPVPGSATASTFTVPQSSPTTDLNSATLYAPSPYQGGTLPLHHYSGPPATSAYAPSHPSAAQSGSSSCPFNPPLPTSYAVVSQRTERGMQPAQEYSAAFSRSSDLLSRLPFQYTSMYEIA